MAHQVVRRIVLNKGTVISAAVGLPCVARKDAEQQIADLEQAVTDGVLVQNPLTIVDVPPALYKVVNLVKSPGSGYVYANRSDGADTSDYHLASNQLELVQDRLDHGAPTANRAMIIVVDPEKEE